MAALSNHINVICLVLFIPDRTHNWKRYYEKQGFIFYFHHQKYHYNTSAKQCKCGKNWVKTPCICHFYYNFRTKNLNCLATEWRIMFYYERHIYKSNPTWLISISQYSSCPFLLNLNRDHNYNYGEVYK